MGYRLIYSDNNFTTVYLFCKNITNISLHLYPPSEDSQCDKKFNYFGVLYRQLLPRFKFEIPNVTSAVLYYDIFWE